MGNHNAEIGNRKSYSRTIQHPKGFVISLSNYCQRNPRYSNIISLIFFWFLVFSQDWAGAQKLAQKIFQAMMKRQRGRAFLFAKAKMQKH